MPSYDSARGRLRLADPHVAVLGHLADGQTPPDDLAGALAELQHIGLVGPEGELSPLLKDLVLTFADPMVMVHAEVTGEHGVVTNGLVVGQEAVIVYDGWPGDEEKEYVSAEPSMLVWEVARLVNLRTGETVDPPVRRIETTMGVLDAAFVALGETPGAEILEAAELAREAVADAGGPAEPALSLFADLVAALNCTWRVTTVWDGKHEGERAASLRALAVWDCGPLGYWLREQPEEPVLPGQVTPDSPLHLVRVSAAEVWERLTDLLPDRADLIDATPEAADDAES
ncbi:MAG: hypothetical protein HOW71_31315 [Nonomuraea sp.]|nr:hypothetical protein [Nonomuraea sp.]NUS12048.1 hypothetical protein [Streptomyces sp.]